MIRRNRKRHHNNKGYRQIKNGTCEKEIKRIAKKLGVNYGKSGK